MKKFNLSEWALDHRSFVAYLMIVFLVAGVYSYLKLGRDEDPPFVFNAMLINVQWPGATTDEMMNVVTDRIEKKLQEIPSLDYVKSETKAGNSTITVALKESTPASEIPNVWYVVRKKIGDISATLPQGVQGPFFDDEFGDTFGTIYAFTSDGFTQRELRDYVTDIRTQLLGVPNTAKISLLGGQDEKVYIEFDTKQLSGLGIDRDQAIESLRAQNAVTPSGVVTTQNDRIILRISGEFTSAQSLYGVNFYANGRFYRLTDVAKIRRGYAEPPQPMFRYKGQPALGLAISMVPGADILQFGDDIRARMAEITANLPIGIEPNLVADQPVVVKQAVSGFLEALWAAIAIVLAVSFLSLGARAGTVVALSIPLVLAIVFTGMEFSGIALQRVSLGALVISLGLLVDDAMITIEMMVSRLELGFDRREAATHAYVTTSIPMLTGTLVTIAGFIPVAFARSSAGTYTFSLFAVISMALITSWVVAVLFAPLLGVTLLPATLPRKEEEKPGRFSRLFRRTLLFCLRAKYLVVAVTLGLFALSVYGALLIPQQFFPSSDRPELMVDMRLAQSASIYQTQAAAERLEKILEGDTEIERYTMYVGGGAPRFYLTLDAQSPNDFFAQAVVVAKDEEARDKVHAHLEEVLREQFPEVLAHVYPLELGPPVGWPLQYRVSGPDVQTLRKYAFQVADILAADPDTRQPNFNWIEPVRSMRIQVDQSKARQLGLSSSDLAQILNTITTGLVITQICDDTYLIDVLGRAVEGERASAQALRNLMLPLRGGKSVPLSDIATVQYGLEQPVLHRRDRLPTITVQSDVAKGVQPETVNGRIADRIAQFAARLPPGYKVVTGGVKEASELSSRSVIDAVPAMLIVMLTVLMVQLQDFRRLFLVLSTAPLGLIGVVAIMLPTRTPMGFIAILGVVALAGMIIRNSVILVDQIAQNVTAGENGWDAVVNATVHRLRPIVLTAAAAILGMLPIARDVFWGPMAFAVIGGLAGATLLTLLFLPALYIIWFGISEPDETPITRPVSASAA